MHDEFEVPPTDRLDAEVVEPVSSWPKVIGIISIIYAIMGLLAVTCGGAMLLLMPFLPEFMGGGAQIPGVIAVTSIATTVVGIVLCIFHLMGAISLVKYRREGVRRLKTWAIARIVWGVVGFGVAIATMPAQLQFQRDIQAKQVAAMQKNSPGVASPFQGQTEEQRWAIAMVTTCATAVVLLIYPVFLGFFLSRKAVTEEVQRWP